MKKLNKLEKVVPVPQTVFYGAYYYNGEDIELCNDKENIEEQGEKTTIEIKDIIKNGTLYKDKILDVIQKDGRHVIEKTHKELPLNKGDRLIYVMYEGFVQTRTPLITIDEAIKRIELLRSAEEG